jgi:hypothetical protein
MYLLWILEYILEESLQQKLLQLVFGAIFVIFLHSRDDLRSDTDVFIRLHNSLLVLKEKLFNCCDIFFPDVDCCARLLLPGKICPLKFYYIPYFSANNAHLVSTSLFFH